MAELDLTHLTFLTQLTILGAEEYMRHSERWMEVNEAIRAMLNDVDGLSLVTIERGLQSLGFDGDYDRPTNLQRHLRNMGLRSRKRRGAGQHSTWEWYLPED